MIEKEKRYNNESTNEKEQIRIFFIRANQSPPSRFVPELFQELVEEEEEKSGGGRAVAREPGLSTSAHHALIFSGTQTPDLS